MYGARDRGINDTVGLSRPGHDLSEGYRDCAPGHPRPITFAAKGAPPAAAADTGNRRLSDKDAHDIFLAGLRGKKIVDWWTFFTVDD